MNNHFIDPFLKILPGIDLHGETGDTAVFIIKDFINMNLKLKKNKIYFIHGRNGHVLKDTLHNILKKDKRVEEFYVYGQNDGITIVKLKNSASNK